MISLSISRKYARAFLQIGQREGTYEALGQELERLRDLLRENKELRAVLFSFAYPIPARKGIVSALAKTVGLSKVTVDFLRLLIERERMDHFFEIVRSYQGLCDEVSSRIRATLIAPGDVSPNSADQIKEQLEAKTGKKVILTVERDPSLLGGVLTKIGNVIYDGSLRTQLTKVRENLYKE